MVKRIPTIAVKAVITNAQDQIFFLQRNPARRDSASWELPGGLIEDETPHEALKREVKEELDVEIIIDREIGKWSFRRPLDNQLVQVTNFACHIVSGNIKLNQEHIASQWLSIPAARVLPVKDASIFNALR